MDRFENLVKLQDIKNQIYWDTRQKTVVMTKEEVGKLRKRPTLPAGIVINGLRKPER